jgi:vacuolar protein-sorting-associated protein 4
MTSGNTGKGGGVNNPNEEKDKFKDLISEAILTEKPNVKWEDIAGLENAKSSLKEAVIMPIKFP